MQGGIMRSPSSLSLFFVFYCLLLFHISFSAPIIFNSVLPSFICLLIFPLLSFLSSFTNAFSLFLTFFLPPFISLSFLLLFFLLVLLLSFFFYPPLSLLRNTHCSWNSQTFVYKALQTSTNAIRTQECELFGAKHGCAKSFVVLAFR